MFHVQDIFFLSENVPVRFYPSVGDPDPPGFQFFAVSGRWFVWKIIVVTKFMEIVKLVTCRFGFLLKVVFVSWLFEC